MNSSSLVLLAIDAHSVTLSKVVILGNTILSLPLNAYVMFLILSRASMAQDFFCLNLAVSEALYSLLSLTFFGILEKTNSQWLPYEIFIFSNGLVVTARPLFQCCICVEYYLGVVHPVVFLQCRPLRYRVACCGVAWLITLVVCFCVRYIILVHLYRYIILVQSVLLVSVIVFCCVSVLLGLKQPGPGEGRPQRREGDAVKRRAFNTILLFMVSTLVNMLLFIAATLVQCCLSLQTVNAVLRICTSLALLTGIAQPLFYLYRAAKPECCRRT